MEVLLLGIYAFFVWLIFIKLKWLPWNITSQVIVVIIPVLGLTALILLLNVYAPSSSDVRVYKYTVSIVSQVRGRVVEVPVEEGNRPVKKGDVLFKIDPTPYELAVAQLEAQLANAAASERELDESLRGAKAQVTEAHSAIAQAVARTREVAAKLELARTRVQQHTELVKTGAGSKFELERVQTDLTEMQAQLDTARGVEAQARAAQVRRRPRSNRSSRSSAPRSTASTRRSPRCARSSTPPAGSWSRQWCALPATATSSTCSCDRGPSLPASRSMPS